MLTPGFIITCNSCRLHATTHLRSRNVPFQGSLFWLRSTWIPTWLYIFLILLKIKWSTLYGSSSFCDAFSHWKSHLHFHTKSTPSHKNKMKTNIPAGSQEGWPPHQTWRGLSTFWALGLLRSEHYGAASKSTEEVNICTQSTLTSKFRQNYLKK